jgi:predicted RNA polymerase sigma factor
MQHPTPFVALNKAIAAAYAVSPQAALDALLQIKGLDSYYLYHTALGEVYFDCGRKQEACAFFQKALRPYQLRG